MWALLKVVWHEMSERAFGFGSQTIDSNLLRLVQFWQYSDSQQVFNATVMSDKFWQTTIKVKMRPIPITSHNMKVFGGTNNIQDCGSNINVSWWCVVPEKSSFCHASHPDAQGVPASVRQRRTRVIKDLQCKAVHVSFRRSTFQSEKVPRRPEFVCRLKPSLTSHLLNLTKFWAEDFSKRHWCFVP